MNSLVPALAVRVSGDSVHFELQLSNGGPAAATLNFGTSQRYDFAVATEAGDTLWRWSEELMFAQVTGTETIDPAETLTYRGAWASGERAGVFRAVGRIVSSDRPFELETEFEIGAR